MPTHWKKLTNPNYLGAYAFEKNEEKTGTILSVKQETVTGTDGEKDECIVCRFRENDLKPLILNKENCKTITEIYGTPYIEDWVGKQITMYVKTVKAFGAMVDAVRIKKKNPNKKAPEIKCEGCGQIIKGFDKYGPEQVAQISKNKYGKCLCVECGKKAKAELEKQQTDTNENAPAPEPEQSDLAAQLMAAAEQ